MHAWKVLPLVTLIGAVMALGACSTREVAGTAAGGAAGYEYSNKRAMDQLDEDYKAGRINKDQYERQKKEIQDRSLIQ